MSIGISESHIKDELAKDCKMISFRDHSCASTSPWEKEKKILHLDLNIVLGSFRTTVPFGKNHCFNKIRSSKLFQSQYLTGNISAKLRPFVLTPLLWSITENLSQTLCEILVSWRWIWGSVLIQTVQVVRKQLQIHAGSIGCFSLSTPTVFTYQNYRKVNGGSSR